MVINKKADKKEIKSQENASLIKKIVKKPAAKSVSKVSIPKQSEGLMSEVKKTTKLNTVSTHSSVKGNRVQTAERARREMLKAREK